MRITCKEQTFHPPPAPPPPPRGPARPPPGDLKVELTQRSSCVALLLLHLNVSAVSYVWVVTVLELSFSPFVNTDSQTLRLPGCTDNACAAAASSTSVLCMTETRYHFAHVCWDCRRHWKANIFNLESDSKASYQGVWPGRKAFPPEAGEPDLRTRCAECQKPGTFIGPKFRPPPKRDDKLWQWCEKLYWKYGSVSHGIDRIDWLGSNSW